jgi:hypothetical protein
MRKLKLFALLFLGGILVAGHVAGQNKTVTRARVTATTLKLPDSEKIRAISRRSISERSSRCMG